MTRFLSEAEQFRAKHGLCPELPADEISEVMNLAELGFLPAICSPCYEGEHLHCWMNGCECKHVDHVPEAT